MTQKSVAGPGPALTEASRAGWCSARCPELSGEFVDVGNCVSHLLCTTELPRNTCEWKNKYQVAL